MRRSDEELLECIEKMGEDAVQNGICSFSFHVLRTRVRDIMIERDKLEATVKGI